MPTQETLNEDESNEVENPETKPVDTSAQTLAALERLTKVISRMDSKSGTTPADASKKQEEVGEFGALLQTMLANGVPAKDLEPLVQLHLASQNDLKKQMEKMVKEGTGTTAEQQLKAKCWERADEVLEELSNVTKPRMRQALMDEMWELMANPENDDFASARAAYARGVTPSKKDFEKVARLVLQSAPKEFVKTKGDTKAGSPQLDPGNSRPTPSKGINKDGSVDVSKLTEVERDVYTHTLNVTKSKEIALKALKQVAPLYQR
jgi:hypothetical protein